MPPLLQQINQATGYTPDRGYRSGQVYAQSTPTPFRPTPLARSGGSQADPYLESLNRAREESDRLRRMLEAELNKPRAANYDLPAAYARARQQSEGAVNPLYVKKLNDFLSRQKVERERKEADTGRLNKQIEESLANTLEATGIERGRTAEDVASNIGQINTQAQQYQQEEGNQFDKARAALLGNIATSGLTTSGLGQQQATEQVAGRNIESGKQAESFNVQKRAQELFKTRTFEDLMRSEKLAGKEAGTKKEAVKIDLDRFIEDLSYGETQKRQELEGQRLMDVLQQERSFAKQNFLNFLSTLQNPGVRQATAGAYGGLF